jgi:tellurite resistance protein
MKEIFQEDEWTLLCETPAIVFSVVGSADGKIDKKELEAFEHFTKKKNAFSSALFNQILPDNPALLIESVQQKKYDKNEVKEKLRSVDNILDNKVDAIDAKLFKHHLIALGTLIANASGKMFSDKISEEENEALVTLGKFIDVDVNHLFRSTLIDEILKKI